MSSKKPATKPATKTAAKPAAKPGAKAPAKKAAAPAKGGASKTSAPAAAAPAPAAPKPKALPIEEISLKELPVVLNDSKGLIKESGRWPLIIDETERVGVFLRHRDCNNLNVLDAQEMDPERIRQALLGAIKYGKPMTINLGECGSIDIMQERFSEIKIPELPNLWELLLTKKILEEDRYMKLVQSNDGEEYRQSTIFGIGEAFTFVFITSNPTITEDTMGKVIVFKIV